MEGIKKVRILAALLLASLLVLCVQDVAAKKCNESMESAGLVEDELDMESMMTSRMLAGSGGYVSYGALDKEKTPCSYPGAPYYKCRQGAATGDVYTRDCSKITQCRTGEMS